MWFIWISASIFYHYQSNFVATPSKTYRPIMVIPSDVTAPPSKVKKYVGNNLHINLLKNDTTLQVTGNNCQVDIEENSGSARIIGDGCELKVKKGKGAIHYIGNFGKIYLGSRGMADKVKYIGNDGKILDLEVTQEKKESLEKGEKQEDKGSDLEKQENRRTKNKVDLEDQKDGKQQQPSEDEESNLEKQRRKNKVKSEGQQKEKGPSKGEEQPHSDKRQENRRIKIKHSEYCAKVSYSSVSNCKNTVSAKKVSNLSDSEAKKANSVTTKRPICQRLCLSIGFNDSFIYFSGKEVKTS